MRRAKPGQTGARGLRNRVSDVPLFSVEEEEEEEEEGSGTLLASVFWAATTLEGSDGSAFWARTCGYTPSATLQRTNYLSVVTPHPPAKFGMWGGLYQASSIPLGTLRTLPVGFGFCVYLDGGNCIWFIGIRQRGKTCTPL